MPTKVSQADYEAIVLGSGPAGFTAGIYLARFGIKTLLLETMKDTSPHPNPPEGRSSVSGFYRNVPGFPEGIARKDFKWRGIQQAIESGADYRIDAIQTIVKDGFIFTVQCDTRTYTAPTLLFALGVEDQWPDIKGVQDFAGQCLFWSVEANGFEAQNKLAGVIGATDHAALEALRLFLMTGQSALFTHGESLSCAPQLRQALKECKIPIYPERIQQAIGEPPVLHALHLENTDVIPVQILFYPEPLRHPHSELAQSMGVHVDCAGFIQVNAQFETNIPHVYAIGDMTARGREQVITACYQGMEAAWSYYEDRFHHTTYQMFGFPNMEALSHYQPIIFPLTP